MLQNHDEPIIGALEMDAACVVVNLFMLPDEPELFRQCVENISRVRAGCHHYGMPLMIEPLVMLPNEVRGGYQVDGDAEKIVTLVRLASEMGADIIKADPTDDPEEFHRVVEAARVPVLVRGGGKEDLKAVLAKSAALMEQGAKGMVYGRNIYQHANPKAVVSALMAMIHQGRRWRGSLGDLQPWLMRDRICSASMPATPSSRRCCSTCEGRQLAAHARGRCHTQAGRRHGGAVGAGALGECQGGDRRLHRRGRHRPRRHRRHRQGRPWQRPLSS